MPYFIRIFCSANSAITRRDIAMFIAEGVYVDQTPAFEPPLDDEESWKRLNVRYSPDKRPIGFARLADPADVAAEIAELLESLPASEARHFAEEKTRQCRQVFVIELDQEGLTEDAWAMLDSLEAHIFPLALYLIISHVFA